MVILKTQVIYLGKVLKTRRLTVYDRTSEDLIEENQGAEIVLTNKTPLKRDVIEKSSMKYIGVLATGFNALM